MKHKSNLLKEVIFNVCPDDLHQLPILVSDISVKDQIFDVPILSTSKHTPTKFHEVPFNFVKYFTRIRNRPSLKLSLRTHNKYRYNILPIIQS